jgi:hypothetical protein
MSSLLWSSRFRYLVERMKGLELYDLWLRAGHRHPASWVEFLCEGEGVFGDCLLDSFHPAHWPTAYKEGNWRNINTESNFLPFIFLKKK